jgi:hypothetical protein
MPAVVVSGWRAAFMARGTLVEANGVRLPYLFYQTATDGFCA